ncbi:hypothetical protein FIBSPDRAFT_477445 [Athelia psychrophila]|uniref:Uncharacterized protein n=1 Tax=Athelia psychrophila TaxID=1759441 RepID=A0A167TYJ6_9AGAM|nr:hypothetical protein FIBSPDRAFT_477445 [Fibularhizoctonia sp. CBS 109695]
MHAVLTRISTILEADQNKTDAADNVGVYYVGTPTLQHNLKRTDASVQPVSSLNTAFLAPEHSISSGDHASPVPDPPSRPPATSMAVDPGPVRSLALDSPSVTKSKSKATSAGTFPPLGLASPTSTAFPSPRSTPGPVTAPAKSLFLRTPFDTRLTYAALAEHPHWFLDRADFAPDGPALPRALCPRGEGEACYGDDKGRYEGKFGQEYSNEPIRLRCPFCRKSMTGGGGEGKEVRARQTKRK